MLVSLVLTGGPAATTGGYPLIIKLSFDTLMKPGSQDMLPWVLGAIVGTTTMRSIFLYLHQVTAATIVMRMTTDIQKAAFAHLSAADSPASRARPPATRVAAHQRRQHPSSRRTGVDDQRSSGTSCR